MIYKIFSYAENKTESQQFMRIIQDRISETNVENVVK